MLTLLKVVIILFAPALVLKITEKYKLLQTIGAITSCYLLGLFISFLPVSFDKELTQTLASVLVAISIPLILFGFDIRSVQKLSKKTSLSFILVILSVSITSIVTAIIAGGNGYPLASEMAGMATGLYIGGTPNMFAIGDALLKDSTIINMAVISDSIIGGIYFLMVLTIVKKIYQRILNKGNNRNIGKNCMVGDINIESFQNEFNIKSIPRDKKSLFQLTGLILLAIACFGIGVTVELLVNHDLSGSLYIIVTASVLGLLLSFVKPVCRIQGSYQIGQYLILAFALSLSMSFDLSAFSSGMIATFAFFVCIQFSTVILHFILCKLFHIDGGTALITSIAGIYGPPFIAPTAESYGDKDLILPGVICGLFGLITGTFIGLGVSTLLKLLIPSI